VALAGGGDRLLPLPARYRHTLAPLMPAAVDASGRLLVTLTRPDSFYYQVATIDAAKGSLRPIPLAVEGDVLAPAWLATGDIMAIAESHRQTIWRYALKGR
jgi:hypothetical protein